jgi:hypothetical protein
MTAGFALPPRATVPRVRWADTNERDATFATTAPRMPWDKFRRDVFRPLPGEHVTVIGSTGKGKSNLLNHVYDLYPYIAVLATKTHDATMDQLAKRGYVVWPNWRSLPASQYPRRIIWPRGGKLADMVQKQRVVFDNVIEHIFAEGGQPANAPVGWAIGIDELWWFTNILNMDLLLRLILQQARSAGITLIGGTQRAAYIPTEFVSQPTHLFFFAKQDDNNLQRLGDINASNKRLIQSMVVALDSFQFLYVNNVTGQMARSRTPPPVPVGK